MAVLTGNANQKKNYTPKGGNGNGGGNRKDDNKPYSFNAPVEIVKFNIANSEGSAGTPWSPNAENFDSVVVKFDYDLPELGVKKGDERTIVRPKKLKDRSLGIKEFSKSIGGRAALEPGDRIALEGLAPYVSKANFDLDIKGRSVTLPEGFLAAQYIKSFAREVELDKFDGKSLAVIHHGPVSFSSVYGDAKKFQRVRMFHEDKEVFIDADDRVMLGEDASEEEIVSAADKNVEAICKAFDKAFKDYDYGYGTPGAMIRVFPDVSGLSKEEAIERATLNPDTFPSYYDVFSRVPFKEDADGKRIYQPITEATVKQMTDNLRKLNEDFKVLDAKVQAGENMTEEEIARHEQAQQFQEFVDAVAIESNLVEVIPTSSSTTGKMSLEAQPGKKSLGEIAATRCTKVVPYPVVDDNGSLVVDAETGAPKTQDIRSPGGILPGSVSLVVYRKWQIELEDGRKVDLPEGTKVNASGDILGRKDRRVAIDPKTGEVAEEGAGGITTAQLSDPEGFGGFVKSYIFDYGRRSPAITPEFLITKGLSEKLGANGPAIEDHTRAASLAAVSRHYENLKNEQEGQENKAPASDAQEKKISEPEPVKSEPEMDDEVPF